MSITLQELPAHIVKNCIFHLLRLFISQSGQITASFVIPISSYITFVNILDQWVEFFFIDVQFNFVLFWNCQYSCDIIVLNNIWQPMQWNSSVVNPLSVLLCNNKSDYLRKVIDIFTNACKSLVQKYMVIKRSTLFIMFIHINSVTNMMFPCCVLLNRVVCLPKLTYLSWKLNSI